MLFSSDKTIYLLRLSMGFIFLWAFADKLLGLGFATPAEKSWLAGASPTAGFLQFGTHGPLAEIYRSLAGNQVVDWLFMLGLLAIGLGLVSGIMVKLATLGGAVLMALIYLSAFPPQNNPLLDEHIIYILVFILIGVSKRDNWWTRTKLVQQNPWLS